MSAPGLNAKKPAGGPAFSDSMTTRKKAIHPTPAAKATQHRPDTHPARILQALFAGERLTAADAWRRYSCMRLASVIHALRRDGWQIEADTIGVRTAAGKMAYVASYRLRSRP